MTRATSKEHWWQRWMTLIVAVIAFIGGVLGAGIPHLLFSKEETEKRLLDGRMGAYNDFFKGQVKNIEANALRNNHPDKTVEADQADKEYLDLVNEARFKIAVYGTKADITAIVKYFRNFTICTCDGPRAKWEDDSQIYQRIRNGFFANDASEQVDNKSLILLLYNCDEPD
jgi:hypothetical protein